MMIKNLDLVYTDLYDKLRKIRPDSNTVEVTELELSLYLAVVQGVMEGLSGKQKYQPYPVQHRQPLEANG